MLQTEKAFAFSLSHYWATGQTAESSSEKEYFTTLKCRWWLVNKQDSGGIHSSDSKVQGIKLKRTLWYLVKISIPNLIFNACAFQEEQPLPPPTPHTHINQLRHMVYGAYTQTCTHSSFTYQTPKDMLTLHDLTADLLCLPVGRSSLYLLSGL